MTDYRTYWYGVAPHHHDLTKTGSFLGSTVLDPLPEPDEDGVYHLPGGICFRPDPDCPRCGTYWSQSWVPQK